MPQPNTERKTAGGVSGRYGTGAIRRVGDRFLLEHINLNQFESDRFIWRWTANGEYSASSAYRSFFIGTTRMRQRARSVIKRTKQQIT